MVSNIPLKTIAEKRNFLRRLSKAVAEMVTKQEYSNINAAVIDIFYKDGQHIEFKTFPEWQEQGYSIKKGSKAFLIWGKPIKGKAEQVDTETENFYPIVFLFSNVQVERRPSNV